MTRETCGTVECLIFPALGILPQDDMLLETSDPLYNQVLEENRTRYRRLVTVSFINQPSNYQSKRSFSPYAVLPWKCGARHPLIPEHHLSYIVSFSQSAVPHAPFPCLADIISWDFQM